MDDSTVCSAIGVVEALIRARSLRPSPAAVAEPGTELAALRAELDQVRAELQRERERVAALAEQLDALQQRQVKVEEQLAVATSRPAPSQQEERPEPQTRYAIGRWHRRLGTGPGARIHENFDDPMPEFEGY